MRPWLRRTIGSVAVALFVIAVMALYIFVRNGGTRDLDVTASATCRALEGPGSAEDIAFDRRRGEAWISVAVRGGPMTGANAGIARFLPDGAAAAYVPQDITWPDGFMPHGISYYEDGTGIRRLFVISHAPDAERIEIFDIDATGTLSHAETIEDALFYSPNNLVAVGPRSFYLVNDKGSETELGVFLEIFLGAALSKIIYFDGVAATVVAEDTPSSAGVGISPDGNWLYVGGLGSRGLEIYARDQATGALTPHDSIDLNTASDNVEVGPDGAVWIAAHPNTFKLISHFVSGGVKPTPSEILKIPMANGRAGAVEQIYLDDGKHFSAIAVAAPWGDGFVMGSITEKRLLVCE